MILILGGAGAGKHEFAQSLGYTEDEMSRDVYVDAPVVTGLEETVRKDPEQADVLLPALLKKEVVICCEVGSGVIPLMREDRTLREATGRLCVKLAQQAESVVRVVAGIPMAIKGELPCRRS